MEEKVIKEVQKTIKQAAEEIRGRELTPDSVQVHVRIRTKEGRDIVHISNPVPVEK